MYDGMTRNVLIWLAGLLAVAFALGATLARGETELQAEARLAPKYHAQQEVRLPGGERVDLLNDIFAFEIEWARPEKRWEAIGQAMFYAKSTDRRPAIILLVTDPAAQASVVASMRRRCEVLGIELFVETATAEVPRKTRRGRR